MTNIVIYFELNGGKYVYRHPGAGSDILVDRGRETIIQSIVSSTGLDPTLIAMDVEGGWRISKYVYHYDFDYNNMNDMVRAIMLLRKIHSIPCKVRWNFDIITEVEKIERSIPKKFHSIFPEYESIRARCYQLNDLTKQDGIKKCITHGDARDVNFLINKDDIYLIDWEYGGFGDPGFDIGSYICGGRHSKEDVDDILYTYFRRKPNQVQKRHFYAYIALTGWFFMHWTMLKESKNQKIGELKELWYEYAR